MLASFAFVLDWRGPTGNQGFLFAIARWTMSEIWLLS